MKEKLGEEHYAQRKYINLFKKSYIYTGQYFQKNDHSAVTFKVIRPTTRT